MSHDTRPFINVEQASGNSSSAVFITIHHEQPTDKESIADNNRNVAISSQELTIENPRKQSNIFLDADLSNKEQQTLASKAEFFRNYEQLDISSSIAEISTKNNSQLTDGSQTETQTILVTTVSPENKVELDSLKKTQGNLDPSLIPTVLSIIDSTVIPKPLVKQAIMLGNESYPDIIPDIPLSTRTPLLDYEDPTTQDNFDPNARTGAQEDSSLLFRSTNPGDFEPTVRAGILDYSELNVEAGTQGSIIPSVLFGSEYNPDTAVRNKVNSLHPLSIETKKNMVPGTAFGSDDNKVSLEVNGTLGTLEPAVWIQNQVKPISDTVDKMQSNPEPEETVEILVSMEGNGTESGLAHDSHGTVIAEKLNLTQSILDPDSQWNIIQSAMDHSVRTDTPDPVTVTEFANNVNPELGTLILNNCDESEPHCSKKVIDPELKVKISSDFALNVHAQDDSTPEVQIPGNSTIMVAALQSLNLLFSSLMVK
jgi:hypothetical protein